MLHNYEGGLVLSVINMLGSKYKIELTEQQLSAATHGDGPALVLAGPGSGKTTVITARTAFLVMKAGVDPESILTLTFNRAARFEMENLCFWKDAICLRHFWKTQYLNTAKET